MAETLYIRLGSQPTDMISWLVYSTSEQDIIASGELPDAQALSQITERSVGRKVIAFVNASDIMLHRLNVPAKSSRAMRQAAPYMIEDDIAQDVEELFFAFGQVPSTQQEHNCYLAGVDKTQLEQWLAWLSDANIHTDTLIPDAMALPYEEGKWSLVQLGEQVLIKQEHWQAICLDNALFEHAMQQWQQDDSLTLATYSPFAFIEQEHNCKVEVKSEELPLALLAQHVSKSSFNLLQGEYQVKLTQTNHKKPWLIAASLAGLALIVNLSYSAIELYQVNQEQQATELAIVETYKKAFPDAKRVKASTVRSQMNRKLAELGEGGSGASFLGLLNKIQPAFQSVPEIKPESVKYDGKRNELRLTAIGQNYQAFDRFKTALEKLQLTVNIGSQNNQGDRVVGSISIKG